MISQLFSNRAFMQVCFVVPDLRSAISSWVSSTGVGPFFWFSPVVFTDGRYRGIPADFPAIKAAIAYAGDMQIELVSQDRDEPSIFRDTIPFGQAGLHHMALYCLDYEAERDTYIEAGAELAFEGINRGVRTCWLDTTRELGFMVELIERSEAREAHFLKMKDAAEHWDGKVPIIGLAS